MAVSAQLSPVRPITDQIPAAAVPSASNPQGWSFRSHKGAARGVVVKSIIGSDGSTPTVIWVGFNKQPPVQMQVQDSFEYAPGFASVEFYNNTAVSWTLIAATFDGDLIP
jgi:hypothetical protein